MSTDINKTFVSLSGIILLAGLVAITQIGAVGILLAFLMCYTMLIATNAIKRGENKAKRR
jgi:uncharacterized membrane protein YozB (DUF420 family)